MCNNWSYKFRVGIKEKEVKMARVILKTKEVVMIQADLLHNYIRKNKSNVMDYRFI